MITSTTNAQIKNIIKLQKSARERKKQGVFLAEGIRLFQEIPKEQLVKVYVTKECYDRHEAFLQEVEYEFVTEGLLKEIADTKTPQGIIAVVKMCHYTLEQIKREKNPVLIVLENLQDPGNLGTIIRTSEGAGIHAILMSEDTVDVYNPKVVRATMGSLFRMPFCILPMEEILTFLEEENITTYGAHLQGNDFYIEDYTKSCAFFIGNEGNGLSNQTMQRLKKAIRIPMYGKVESLNAAIAGTILMYEAMRQRREK